MPLLTELFILFGLNYNDAAPAALNAALGISAFASVFTALRRDQPLRRDKRATKILFFPAPRLNLRAGKWL
jgi:hypothetical protein